MTEVVAQSAAQIVASYGGNAVIQAAAYYAVIALETYALNRLAASLGASKPKGEGRGLEVAITDTGQAAFALYGMVRVGGSNIIP